MKTCLLCIEPIDAAGGDYHPKCSRTFFGHAETPVFPYRSDELHELGHHNISQRITVTGVQPKLSLAFEKDVLEGAYRLTLVGLWGQFILKPPNQVYLEIVENEYATMRMAQTLGIPTVPFAYIRLQSGGLAYITRRIDRTNKGKLAMEDFCQLSQKLTEYKYRGSLEQAAKVIRKYSSNPGLDLVRFAELNLFCWLTGNADMHLKNFSLLTNAQGSTNLAPAYDLVFTKLLMPKDEEETALTLNGKKNRIGAADFMAFAKNIGLPEKAWLNVLTRFEKKLPKALLSLSQSLLSDETKQTYRDFILKQAERIFLKSE
jgi:serine/threonine-protein kinase HipA